MKKVKGKDLVPGKIYQRPPYKLFYLISIEPMTNTNNPCIRVTTLSPNQINFGYLDKNWEFNELS